MRRSWRFAACLAAPLLGALAGAVGDVSQGRADTFVLTNNGQVDGELVNKDESPRQKYVIRTPSGGTVTLERSMVARVVARTAKEEEYDRIRGNYPDTVDGQWQLAEWCRQQGLVTVRKKHLARVIELDPEHADARRALGYTKFGGRWMTQAEVMTKRGFVRYQGHWRLPQDVELMQKRHASEVAEKEWFKNINRWIGWLDDDKADQGVEKLRAINDPAAVPALAQNLARETNQATAVLLIEALARVGTPEAHRVLGQCSLESSNDEVRLTCLDYLKKAKPAGIVSLYIRSLRSNDNQIINRAAVGLKAMSDPAAVRPLIDALVTTHKTKLRQGSGAMSATFGGPGSGPPGFAAGPGGLSVGGGTKVLVEHVQNSSVLDALVSLAGGVNYGYEVHRWKNWLRAQSQTPELDARRN